MTSASTTDNVSAMNGSNPTPPNPTTHPHHESERTAPSEDDRVLCEFLTQLEDDIRSHPEKLIALDSTLLARLDSLVGGIEVDINFPLSADDE